MSSVVYGEDAINPDCCHSGSYRLQGVKSFPLSVAGVSSKYDFDVNSLAVPRKAKEAIGGIARLRHDDGRCMTINVEYNQLDPLLRATGNGQGDVNDEDGWSSYPGK